MLVVVPALLAALLSDLASSEDRERIRRALGLEEAGPERGEIDLGDCFVPLVVWSSGISLWVAVLPDAVNTVEVTRHVRAELLDDLDPATYVSEYEKGVTNHQSSAQLYVVVSGGRVRAWAYADPLYLDEVTTGGRMGAREFAALDQFMRRASGTDRFRREADPPFLEVPEGLDPLVDRATRGEVFADSEIEWLSPAWRKYLRDLSELARDEGEHREQVSVARDYAEPSQEELVEELLMQGVDLPLDEDGEVDLDQVDLYSRQLGRAVTEILDARRDQAAADVDRTSSRLSDSFRREAGSLENASDDPLTIESLSRRKSGYSEKLGLSIGNRQAGSLEVEFEEDGTAHFSPCLGAYPSARALGLVKTRAEADRLPGEVVWQFPPEMRPEWQMLQALGIWEPTGGESVPLLVELARGAGLLSPRAEAEWAPVTRMIGEMTEEDPASYLRLIRVLRD